MSLFYKHEVVENGGRYEVALFLKKKNVDFFEDNMEIGSLGGNKLNVDALEAHSFHDAIKNAALAYIDTHVRTIPIQVVRIMIGSVPYMSFAKNVRQE